MVQSDVALAAQPLKSLAAVLLPCSSCQAREEEEILLSSYLFEAAVVVPSSVVQQQLLWSGPT